MTERLITAALLRKRKACEGQVDAFEREWPEGMAVTAANLARCRALGLNVEWGVRLLSKRQQAAYEAALAPARAAYNAALAAAWVAYEAAKAPALVAAWEAE